jgi:hypothetical protein
MHRTGLVQAEFLAIERALDLAVEASWDGLTLRTSSGLVLGLLDGILKPPQLLRAQVVEIHHRMAELQCRIQLVRDTPLADRLCYEALDGQTRGGEKSADAQSAISLRPDEKRGRLITIS